jgi:hypothetical protein
VCEWQWEDGEEEGESGYLDVEGLALVGESIEPSAKTVELGVSAGLDTTWMIKWVDREREGCSVSLCTSTKRHTHTATTHM